METTLRTLLIPIRYDESKADYAFHPSSEKFALVASFEADLKPSATLHMLTHIGG
jgi:hypothetical protein